MLLMVRKVGILKCYKHLLLQFIASHTEFLDQLLLVDDIVYQGHDTGEELRHHHLFPVIMSSSFSIR